MVKTTLNAGRGKIPEYSDGTKAIFHYEVGGDRLGCEKLHFLFRFGSQMNGRRECQKIGVCII